MEQLKFSIADSEKLVTCGTCGSPLHVSLGTFPIHYCRTGPRNLIATEELKK